jgi:beta-glucosidase
VSDWVTINEPMVVIALGYLHYVSQSFPPGKNDPKSAHVALRNMLLAHRDAYLELHSLAAKTNTKIRVGVAYHFRVFDPGQAFNPLDVAESSAVDWFSNWIFVHAVETGKLYFTLWPDIARENIPGLAGTEDFIGVNYYTRDFVGGANKHENMTVASYSPVQFSDRWNGAVTDTDWQIYPEGMYRVLKSIHHRYSKKRIFITENGIADASDTRRPQFILDHLAQIHRAIQEGIPVDGYCHWSLMDNFEWSMGFGPRFGLFAVDYQTLERVPRFSARVFAKIASANGFPYPAVPKPNENFIAQLSEKHFVR